MCSSSSSNPEKARIAKELGTVKDKSLMNGVNPAAEPLFAFSERARDGMKKQKLGGQPTETTQTPTVTPQEVNSLGGATALDRKNKKGVASTITSNTILGSSKGG